MSGDDALLPALEPWGGIVQCDSVEDCRGGDAAGVAERLVACYLVGKSARQELVGKSICACAWEYGGRDCAERSLRSQNPANSYWLAVVANLFATIMLCCLLDRYGMRHNIQKRRPAYLVVVGCISSLVIFSLIIVVVGVRLYYDDLHVVENMEILLAVLNFICTSSMFVTQLGLLSVMEYAEKCATGANLPKSLRKTLPKKFKLQLCAFVLFVCSMNIISLFLNFRVLVFIPIVLSITFSGIHVIRIGLRLRQTINTLRASLAKMPTRKAALIIQSLSQLENHILFYVGCFFTPSRTMASGCFRDDSRKPESHRDTEPRRPLRDTKNFKGILAAQLSFHHVVPPRSSPLCSASIPQQVWSRN